MNKIYLLQVSEQDTRIEIQGRDGLHNHLFFNNVFRMVEELTNEVDGAVRLFSPSLD
jgi:hypothetical protein